MKVSLRDYQGTALADVRWKRFICNQCFAVFHRKKHLHHPFQYCGVKCAGAAKKSATKPLPPMSCNECGGLSTYAIRSSHLNAMRRGVAFCSSDCRDKTAARRSSITMRATNLSRREHLSQRMKDKNPMARPSAKAAMIASMKGRTFLARGGNGQPTRQQLVLHQATGLQMEYPISTASVTTQFKSLPTCYKVDLAVAGQKLAIEVDGKTHRLKLWRFLDARKTEVLAALGWRVIRFTNEEVDADLGGCVAKINEAVAQ